MKPKLLLFAMLLFSAGIAAAQSYTVHGTIKDTSAHVSLPYASVQLLRAKDSVLVTFTRTDASGSFNLKNVPAGSYVVLITYPKYADYADWLEIKKDEDLGSIALITQATALQNVIVRGGGSIRMRGDTTAFMADSFKVREGASVEDLLKKLPGITVNKKGEITAMGEKVEKVLVDGEEFFGDDPTMATQNLQASTVKEVQVFDKKSDQATFTGVDDGQKTKTINLKLKDEAKKGYFGKLNIGGGVPNRWDNTAMVNSFKNKRKISLFGQMSNTGRTGLNWQEEQNYGGNANTEISDDGGIYISYSGDEFGSGDGFYGQGLPRSWNVGTNFGNKWNSDKENLNSSYRYQKLNTAGNTTTQTQYILPSPDTSYNINESNRFSSSRERHKVRGTYDVMMDSMNSFRFTADGSMGKSTAINFYNRQTLSMDSMLINQQARSTNSRTSTNTFNSSGLWRKKFKTLRRTLSVNFSQNYYENEGDNFLRSNERYYTGGQLTKDTLTDQMKVSNNRSLTIDTKASYTEPVSKNAIVEVNYGYRVSNSENELNSFDKEADKYEKLNVLTSNHFRFVTQTHAAGASYAFSNNTIKFGFGGNAARTEWNQDNLRKDTSRIYRFTNLFPRANFVYMFNRQSALRFNYNGSTQAPSLDQLQPLVNNIDPLNIAVGNPDLKQAFNHRFNVSYNNYKVLTERSIYAYVSFSPTSNAFSTNDRVDSGRRYYQTVNVSGNYSIYSNLYYSLKLKKSGIYISFDPGFNSNRYSNYVNGKLNNTTSYSYETGIRVSHAVDEKYDFSIYNNIERQFSRSSIQPDLATRYWAGEVSADGGIHLPWKMYLNTDLNFRWRERTAVFSQNNTVFLWNAYIERKIFKKKTANINLKVYDILNNNNGISRDIRSNYIRQTNYDILRRYLLLSFVWNFSKNGQPLSDW